MTAVQTLCIDQASIAAELDAFETELDQLHR